jgi:YidC/Oxa1 family membrane protein insertase
MYVVTAPRVRKIPKAGRVGSELWPSSPRRNPLYHPFSFCVCVLVSSSSSSSSPPSSSASAAASSGCSIALVHNDTVVRTLLVPLSIQQSQSSEYMKALKPYMAEIKKKYKNNQDAQNRAIAKLYEDAKQNPLSGCLLSFAQIPVFLGLYRGVRYLALEGELDERFLWIPSLAGPVNPPEFRGLDWLLDGWTFDGTPTPPLGWETTLAFMIMPVVLVLLQSATMQVLQPPVDDSLSEDEQQQMKQTQNVIKFLPLLIGFFSLQVPAGLTIYWFTSNLFTVTQSLAVRAYFSANPPEIELPDYWDKTLEADQDYSKMSAEERRQASEAGLRVGPTLSEMVDESKFHVYVERRSFREETPAWQRVAQAGGKQPLPEELQAWVKGSAKAPASSEAPVQA